MTQRVTAPRRLALLAALLFLSPLGAIAQAQVDTDPSLVRIDDMLVPAPPARPGLSQTASVTTPFTPWPGGVVPVEFAPGITDDQRTKVFAACSIWSKRAAVSCVARSNERSFVRVTGGSGGCYASVGVVQSARMNLDVACWTQKSVLHELGHVFGLHHEHQRPDRDQYISIDLSVVDPAYHSAFATMAGAQTRGAYDFLSVMHYHDFAFGNRALARTMIPKPGFEWYANALGGSDFPSPGDGDAMQALYGGGAAYWPARPANLRVAQIAAAGTAIQWDPPVGGPQVTGYEVILFSGASFLESSISQVFNLAPTSTGVTLNLQAGHYFLTVKGTSADGEYARSTVLSFSVNGASGVQAPVAPQLQAAAAGPGQVSLSWNRGTGAFPTHYTVYAGTTPGSSNLGSFPMGAATSMITSAPAGSTAYVRIVASNENGGALSNEVSFFVPNTNTTSAPQVTVQANANPVSVTWTRGENPASNYVLVASSAPGGADVGVFPMGQAQGIVANAPVGMPLYVRVLSVGAAGTLVSNEVQFMVPAALDAAPATLAPATVHGTTVGLAWGGSNAQAYTLVARVGSPSGPVVATIPVGKLQSISIPNAPRGDWWVSVASTPGFAESNAVLVSVR